MSVGLRRSIGRSDKDKILLDRVLFWRGRRLLELLQCRVLIASFQRLNSLFEGGVMRPNLEAVPVC
jgi:hypothetical protein